MYPPATWLVSPCHRALHLDGACFIAEFGHRHLSGMVKKEEMQKERRKEKMNQRMKERNEFVCINKNKKGRQLLFFILVKLLQAAVLCVDKGNQKMNQNRMAG